jgi:hypothetical protein
MRYPGKVVVVGWEDVCLLLESSSVNNIFSYSS